MDARVEGRDESDVWRLSIDGDAHEVFHRRIPAIELFDLAGKSPHEWVLEVELDGDARASLDKHEHVDLSADEVTRFHLRPRHHRRPQPLALVVVVNSEPIAVEAVPSELLSALVDGVLERAKPVGRADDEWQLKTEAGVVLDLALTVEAAGIQDGATLFLSLKAGAAGEADVEALVDPAVSRAKFDREVAAFGAVAAANGRRGVWLIRAEYPRVVLAFAAPNTGPLRLVAFGAVVDFRNYDLWAPSVRIVDPITEVPYRANELPPHAQLLRLQPPATRAPTDPAVMEVGRFMQWHRPDEVPFLCHPGVREYHQHPAHDGDSWLLHRGKGEGTLSRIIDILFQYGSSKVVGFQVGPAIATPDP
ncbi:putative metal-binding protein [Lichenibacterium dinghuense]|uniref:putative metal-binding protein n=1 Tax=Lichenibacterium dinghuense TaxID=2895977 RepID=UPI001F483FAA|nr:putative metal-binding protein [Lichenibacterium sp. 6Y81]